MHGCRFMPSFLTFLEIKDSSFLGEIGEGATELDVMPCLKVQCLTQAFPLISYRKNCAACSEKF